MKSKPLTAILTLLVVLPSSFAATGCGGKSASSSSAKPATSSTPATTPTTSKHKSKPAY